MTKDFIEELEREMTPEQRRLVDEAFMRLARRRSAPCSRRCWSPPYPTCDCGARANNLTAFHHVISCPCDGEALA